MSKKIMLSGVQPSGDLHIGNYLGAIRNWARYQEEYASFFFIAYYHAITEIKDPQLMREATCHVAADVLACGVDPEKCTFFVQSHARTSLELCWVLSCVTSMGDLERMTQYKDKARQLNIPVNAGLFLYPVLQAADILAFKTHVVPVGDDQCQHLELAREIVRRFNTAYGETFPEPQQLLSEVPRLLGLDGDSKMSKSKGNTISLIDDPESIKAKLKPAKTDVHRQRRSDPGDPSQCNVYTIHQGFSDPATCAQVDRDCRAAAIGCIDCKMMLADKLAATLAPIRERSRELRRHPDQLREILRQGSARATLTAETTMNEVRDKLGLFHP